MCEKHLHPAFGLLQHRAKMLGLKKSSSLGLLIVGGKEWPQVCSTNPCCHYSADQVDR